MHIAMPQKLVHYVLFFFIPGTLSLVFGRRMIDSNARSYPWAYPPVMRLVFLLLAYFTGMLLIVGGFLVVVLGNPFAW